MKRILITPGEPAGIGPDITIQIAQAAWTAELIAIADPLMLEERARAIQQPLTLIETHLDVTPTPHQPGTLKVIPVALKEAVIPGELNVCNAPAVIQALKMAADGCRQQKADAIVTGPVHKEIINRAGIPFTGHTEFFEQYCQVAHTLMLFVAGSLRVALATTHLPLRAVPDAITKARLEVLLLLLTEGLRQFFQIPLPKIRVAGLNPHAGEGGILGREEIEIILPVIEALQKQGYQIEGPLAADTIFTQKQLGKADAILAMYHDQALPAIKHISFGSLVNVTLGLPFIRTSVDHGVALDVAASGKADASSLQAAIVLACSLTASPDISSYSVTRA
ncbi:MAG: 4-hydroxythreonine-4-phosphate dehydrogenase PdxA [Gammaproteobacteria bacterium RIFCSPHIGHO2_12_FULL_42_10]|nr:MAG: 4-hydroxythreonine-4-phosphate dehydrogenase PdxA [Gammaproteobacteria bacterium RIFCSPHIGHO2_12_FULL_42_10]